MEVILLLEISTVVNPITSRISSGTSPFNDLPDNEMPVTLLSAMVTSGQVVTAVLVQSVRLDCAVTRATYKALRDFSSRSREETLTDTGVVTSVSPVTSSLVTSA